jgi:hypothetical protein
MGSPTGINVRKTLLIASAAVFLFLNGCSGTASDQRPYESAETPLAPHAGGGVGKTGPDAVVGLWEGTTRNVCGINRCAWRNVTFTLLQQDASRLGGIYTCAYGNLTCLRQNTSGKIATVTLESDQITMRVIMEDGTSCLFRGAYNRSDAQGGYTCQGDEPSLERGWWRVKKIY